MVSCQIYLVNAEYQPGKLYCFGQGVPQNLEVGMDWLRASASHGNEYASALLEKVQNYIYQQTAFATLALQNGIDVKTVSSMLGHSSAGFTLAIYTHATNKVQEQAAAKMGSLLKQAL